MHLTQALGGTSTNGANEVTFEEPDLTDGLKPFHPQEEPVERCVGQAQVDSIYYSSTLILPGK